MLFGPQHVAHFALQVDLYLQVLFDKVFVEAQELHSRSEGPINIVFFLNVKIL